MRYQCKDAHIDTWKIEEGENQNEIFLGSVKVKEKFCTKYL